jgi:hypothetical protein
VIFETTFFFKRFLHLLLPRNKTRMKKRIYSAFLFLVVTTFVSCNTIKNSKYTVFTKFYYANEQPRFNFQNDSLKITGAWDWATSARAIPKNSYIPKTVLQVLKPIAKEHGAVLFAAWAPNRKKFVAEGYVPVSKEDVQFSDELNKPFFIIALVNDHHFKADTTKYKQCGRNNDYQFDLYASIPTHSINDYWIMEVITAAKNRYYNFVCILDKSYMSDPEVRAIQASRFFEDIQKRFSENGSF